MSHVVELVMDAVEKRVQLQLCKPNETLKTIQGAIAVLNKRLANVFVETSSKSMNDLIEEKMSLLSQQERLIEKYKNSRNDLANASMAATDLLISQAATYGKPGKRILLQILTHIEQHHQDKNETKSLAQSSENGQFLSSDQSEKNNVVRQATLTACQELKEIIRCTHKTPVTVLMKSIK